MEKETEIILPKPSTIGIIMDGNRRYAKEKGKKGVWGHMEGFKKVKELLSWASEIPEISSMVLYAFSTENWKRSGEEVEGLLKLLQKALTSKSLLSQKKVRIKIIGDISLFPKDIKEAIKKLEKETSKNPEKKLYIALSYGGRKEILSALEKLLKKGDTTLTEESLEKEMWGGDIKPDLIIRTGGEKRLSNFLLWQAAYSELSFTDTLWPALTKEEFLGLIEEYGKRKRNFGK
jgi:undecaprenyl diphosphate synthase